MRQNPHVVVQAADGVLVATVRGELDLHTRERFEQALEPLRDAGDGAVLDLGAVPFMDSSALQVVVQLWRALRDEGRTLAVACGSQSVRRVFELTGLDRVLEVHEAVAPAVRAARGGDPPLSAPGP